MKTEVAKAIILVGGWGTRLRPLTYTIPKPLVPFCNRPMLKYQIEKLVKAGVREIILAVNYYSEIIIGACKEYEEEFGVKIVYSKEDTPLGTGGPLALARGHLAGHSFFVMNSDICCNADLEQMKTEFMESDCLASMMTYPVDDPTKYGLVKVEDGLITSFIEKPKSRGQEAGPWLINAGMYIFSDAVLDYIELREFSLETGLFPVLAAKGQLRSFSLEGYWMDIGQIADYLKGQWLYLQHMSEDDCCKSSQPSESAEINSDGSDSIIPYASPSVHVSSNVVIGKNVKIGTNVMLENCTIFDGAVIGDNTVVTNSVVGWDCIVGNDCYVEDTSALGKGVYINDGLAIRSLRIRPMESVNGTNVETFKINA